MRGQLWRKERRFLRDLVMDYRPQFCFEVGTNRGGGSTLAIAESLDLLRCGMLHTAEILPELHKEAVESFKAESPHLLERITFYCGDARDVLAKPLIAVPWVDLVFLDGSEDPHETIGQVELFEAFSTPGTVFCAHDWGTSQKMSLLKPIIDSGEKHSYIARIYPHGAEYEDGSVGIAAWKMKS